MSRKIMTTQNLPTYYIHHFTLSYSLIQSFFTLVVMVFMFLCILVQVYLPFPALLLLSEFSIVPATIFVSF